MNSYVHAECPICHATLPAAQRPAHLAAHARRNAQAAADRADYLAGLSNAELAEWLRVIVACEMDPLSWECSIVEAAVERLEAMARVLTSEQQARWAAEQNAAHWRECAEDAEAGT